MKIIEALKNEDCSVRLVNYDKWLIWDDEWRVYQRPPYAKKTRTIYRGDSESNAVNILMEE